jgi:hypothetical protein
VPQIVLLAVFVVGPAALFVSLALRLGVLRSGGTARRLGHRDSG